jgi:hypothetical protein
VADDFGVHIRGIKELQAAFRAVSDDLPKELRVEFLAIAEYVVGVAQQRMPYGSGKAASSVKPRASQRGAGIAFGGSKAPYMPWLDFGGSVGRGHQPGQAWSGAIKRPWMGKPLGSGRYIYPAIEESREEIMEAADKAIKKVAESAKFETEGSL